MLRWQPGFKLRQHGYGPLETKLATAVYRFKADRVFNR